jgi:hypothetical protein
VTSCASNPARPSGTAIGSVALRTGTYGGAEYDTEVRQFAKVVASTTLDRGTIDSFTVYYKNGLIGRFELHGKLPATQLAQTSLNVNGSFGSSGTALLQWNLTKLSAATSTSRRRT